MPVRTVVRVGGHRAGPEQVWSMIAQGTQVCTTYKDDPHPSYVSDLAFQPSIDNACVFDHLVTPELKHVESGQSLITFVDGRSGSGKTHTMRGNDQDPGLVPRTLDTIFSKHQPSQVTLSVLEIYNETIRDCLVTRTAKRPRLAQEPKAPSVAQVADQLAGKECSAIKELVVDSVQFGRKLLARAEDSRTYASTARNAASSRGHLVTILNWYAQTETTTKGSILFVDLAGSEGDSNDTKRQSEGANIRKSLSTLGSVLRSLAKGDSYIRYRDSTLTWILKSHLNGQSRITWIATVHHCSPAPDKSALQEGRHALLRMHEVRTIRIAPITRKVKASLPTAGPVDASSCVEAGSLGQISALEANVKKLKGDLRDKEEKLVISEQEVKTVNARVQELEANLESKEKKVEDLQTTLKGLEDSFEALKASSGRDKVNAATKALEDRLAHTRQDLTRYKMENDELKRDLDGTTEKLAASQDICLKLKEDCKKLGQSYKLLQERKNEWKRACLNYEEILGRGHAEGSREAADISDAWHPIGTFEELEEKYTAWKG